MQEHQKPELGAILRQFRKEAKLTVRQLAEAAELSAGHLSQIETGKTTGSLYTLRRIAQALNRPVADLFTDEDEMQNGAKVPLAASSSGVAPANGGQLVPFQSESGVVRSTRRKKLQMAENTFAYELLTPDMRGAIEFLWIEVEPGHPPTELMAHSRSGEECAVVVQGTMWLIIGDSEYVLEAGDSIRFDPAIPHRIENRGAVKLVQISAITPPSF